LFFKEKSADVGFFVVLFLGVVFSFWLFFFFFLDGNRLIDLYSQLLLGT